MSVYWDKKIRLEELRQDYIISKYESSKGLIKKEICKLDAELKDIEKSLGRFCRPVGDYNCQVKQDKNLTLWQRNISIV